MCSYTSPTTTKKKKKNIFPPRVAAGSGSFPKQTYYNQISTESCGKYGEFIVVTVHTSLVLAMVVAPIHSYKLWTIKSQRVMEPTFLINASKFHCRVPTSIYSYTNRMMATQRLVWVTIRKLCFVLVLWDCQTRWQCQHNSYDKKVETDHVYVCWKKLMRDKCEQVLANGGSGMSNKETK